MREYEYFMDGEKTASLFVGYTENIVPLYKSMCRAWEKGHSNICDFYGEYNGRAKFTHHVYGIMVDYETMTFQVIGAEACLSMILTGEWLMAKEW